MKKHFVYVLILLLILVSFPFAVQAESYGWGFKKGTNHQPPEVGKYGNILEENGGFYLDKSGDKVVYLTFDNGYEEGYTEKVLDVLQKKKVPATFFVTGHYVNDQPDLVKRMVNEGHIVGNHSNHHPDFTSLTKQKLEKELASLEEKVASITEQDSMKYVRPPKGAFNEDTIQWANELGYIHMFWSLAFVDWNTNSQKGWQQAYQQVIDQIHPGAVILLHTVSKDNAEALENLIDDLRKQGYSFRSIDELVLKDMIPKSIFGM
ncbi:delta-lactam-biosynthetic de-N-acetylase [Aquibacillus rhizosphaerae]|uniref:Delta-lactam-biosynthetic de-N-acetylase n=1 Tax=Aquibacillus rhizosphaerae TaxID=3051431 RepID=A0ABT7L7K2_9BACI|nr:delta-lactam-biosynthetic de-N-acetylase [Aquibacillus sp. LR5S19]MDL4841838.1 delta-lactam-biosynthetic de-N-acetylase [Aquibacillus sp. LR5S19]